MRLVWNLCHLIMDRGEARESLIRVYQLNVSLILNSREGMICNKYKIYSYCGN